VPDPAAGSIRQLEADATNAYSSSKVLKVLRQWTWRKPDWLIVQDRVVLARPNLPVKSLLHFIERPNVGVTPTTVLGNWSTGGVFTTSVDRTMIIDHGSSSARIYVCAVRGGGSPTSELRIIGGSNSSAQNWKQNQISSDFGYVANASQLSYEFYVEQTGRNYMPSDPNRVNQSDVAARHTPTHLAGDWRAEITVSGARDTVDIAYAVHVTDRGAPVATVSSQWMGGTLAVTAQVGSEAVPFVLCVPGRECSALDRP
jgi:hypothetical protein